MMNKKECLNKAIEITMTRNTGGNESRGSGSGKISAEIEDTYKMLVKLNNECGEEK